MIGRNAPPTVNKYPMDSLAYNKNKGERQKEQEA